FGVPQLRPRLFVLGLRKHVRDPFPEPTHKDGARELFDCRLEATTVWNAIGDLPELDARQGGEEQEYSNNPLCELQEFLRADASVVFNHTAMRHSPRLVERFSLLKWGESGADAPEAHSARQRGDPERLSGKSYDQNNR